MTAEAYRELLRRGWRRFGLDFFRPACPRCVKCRSLRIDVPEFKPSSSQQRNLRRNSENPRCGSASNHDCRSFAAL